MEIIRKFNQEVVESLMEERGYTMVSTNLSGEEVTAINFTKRTDLNVPFHAQVIMKSHSIILSMVELKYMVTLNTGRFDFFHPQFEKYEKIMYLYSEACIGVDNIFKKAEEMTGISAMTSGPNPIIEPKKEIPKKEKKTLEERKKDFWMELAPIAKQKGLTKEFTMEFYAYWTEHGPNDRTFRRETEKKFDISRRLDTFVRNEKKWNKDKVVEKIEKQDKDIRAVKKQSKKDEDLF